jgi:hypothetical protein
MLQKILTPLETFREQISYNPFHFWGLSGSTAPVDSACNTIVHEFSWQLADAAGRDDIRKAILTAERKMKDHLGYYVRPAYVQDVINIGCFSHYMRNYDYSYYGYGYGSGYYRPGYQILLKLSSGQLRAIQTETWSTPSTGAPVITDPDGDGNLDYFKIDIADAVTDPANIEIGFLAADCPANWTADQRRIFPVNVERLNSTTIRVSGAAWLLVAPKRYNALNYGGLDPASLASFVTSLEIFIRTASAANAATFQYYDSAGVFQTSALNVSIENPDAGLVLVSSADCIGICTCNAPNLTQSVAINYRAGADAGDFDTEIAALACAEMRRRVCACETANSNIYAWQVDMALPMAFTKVHISPEDIANPIGTRAGQIAAWKRIQLFRQVRGFFVG